MSENLMGLDSGHPHVTAVVVPQPVDSEISIFTQKSF